MESLKTRALALQTSVCQKKCQFSEFISFLDKFEKCLTKILLRSRLLKKKASFDSFLRKDPSSQEGKVKKQKDYYIKWVWHHDLMSNLIGPPPEMVTYSKIPYPRRRGRLRYSISGHPPKSNFIITILLIKYVILY